MCVIDGVVNVVVEYAEAPVRVSSIVDLIEERRPRDQESKKECNNAIFQLIEKRLEQTYVKVVILVDVVNLVTLAGEDAFTFVYVFQSFHNYFVHDMWTNEQTIERAVEGNSITN